MANKNREKLLFSSIIAAILLVVVYLFDNLPFSISGLPRITTLVEMIRLKGVDEGRNSSKLDTSHVFINVSYDIDLANISKGKEKIVDRALLLRFLKDIEDRHINYKGIFIDVLLLKDLETSVDSLLAAQICKMSNVIVANHWDRDNNSESLLIDSLLQSNHSAYADYGLTVFHNSFSRYQFLQHGTSAALRLYEDTGEGRTIQRIGYKFFSLFFDRGLCFNCLPFSIPEDFSSGLNARRSGKDKFYHLGFHVYGLTAKIPNGFDTFLSMLADKIIIIGDFVYDMHGTYYKSQPGPYLHYLAYKSLEEGRHLVSPLLALGVYLLYLLILLFILHYRFSFCLVERGIKKVSSYFRRIRISLNNKLGSFTFWRHYKVLYARVTLHINHSSTAKLFFRFRRLIRFALSLLEYTTLLFVVSTLCYIVWGVSISVLIPSMVFTLVDYGYKYATYEQ